MLITDTAGNVTQHKIIAALSYASGDRLVIVDCPWQSPTDMFYDPDAVFAYREVNASWHGGPNPVYPATLSAWREVFADLSPVANWARTANLGDQSKIRNRRFTKIDPATLPPTVRIDIKSCVTL